jgi:hypothetical protein
MTKLIPKNFLLYFIFFLVACGNTALGNEISKSELTNDFPQLMWPERSPWLNSLTLGPETNGICSAVGPIDNNNFEICFFNISTNDYGRRLRLPADMALDARLYDSNGQLVPKRWLARNFGHNLTSDELDEWCEANTDLNKKWKLFSDRGRGLFGVSQHDYGQVCVFNPEEVFKVQKGNEYTLKYILRLVDRKKNQNNENYYDFLLLPEVTAKIKIR